MPTYFNPSVSFPFPCVSLVTIQPGLTLSTGSKHSHGNERHEQPAGYKSKYTQRKLHNDSSNTKMTRSFLLLSLCICIVSCQKYYPKSYGRLGQQECNKRLDKVESCVNKILMLADPEMVTIQTRDDLTAAYCDPFPMWLDCMSQYKPCLKPFHRSLFSMGALQAKKMYKKLCFDQEFLDDVVQHIQCLRPENKPTINRLMDTLISLMEYAGDLPPEDLMAFGCCGGKMMSNFTEKEIDRVCMATTGLRTGQFIRQQVLRYAGDSITMGRNICIEFPDQTTCSIVRPDMYSDIMAMITNPKETDRQIVTSALTLLKKLDTKMQQQPPSFF